MDNDSKLIYEALVDSQYETLANVRSKLHLARMALGDCLKHFSAEPEDPGHPHLLIVVKRALEEINAKD